MKGSRIAGQIVNEWKKEQYYKKEIKRKGCLEKEEKKCEQCTDSWCIYRYIKKGD